MAAKWFARAVLLGIAVALWFPDVELTSGADPITVPLLVLVLMVFGISAASAGLTLGLLWLLATASGNRP